MRLTTKGRFAVTAMIDVALHGREGPVNLASISQRQQISLSYLELLFAKLRRHKLVESTRGPGGGYSLARKAIEITVADIVLSIEDEPSADARARGGEAAQGPGRYSTEELWASVNLRAVEFLDSITLQSLVEGQKAKDLAAAANNAAQEDAAAADARVPPRPVPAKPPAVNVPNSVFALGRSLAKR
jgi:Rrf2 family iron-sulfur cluster assembly transcriptional regulator